MSTRRRSGTEPAGDSGREPVPIADALARVQSELGLPLTDALLALTERWSDVVGSEVAAHARLDAVRDGAAAIVVDSPIWASQLRYLEADIVERANALVGAGVVELIRVRVQHS